MRSMKKYMRAIAFFIMVSMIFGTTNVSANAEIIQDLGKIVDGSKLTNDNFAEKIEKSLTKGNILDQGVARISNNGNGSVNIYAATIAHVTCDKLLVKLTLQQYKNGTWYNCGDYSDTNYNSASLSRSYNVSVSRGYYYRVKAACIAYKGSTSESQVPITDGIWIG